MTIADIDPTILAHIRTKSEPVIVDTQEGWRRGVRGLELYALNGTMGRLTITEDDQVFYSMMGSRPTYTREEAYSRVADLEAEAREVQQAIDSL